MAAASVPYWLTMDNSSPSNSICNRRVYKQQFEGFTSVNTGLHSPSSFPLPSTSLWTIPPSTAGSPQQQHEGVLFNKASLPGSKQEKTGCCTLLLQLPMFMLMTSRDIQQNPASGHPQTDANGEGPAISVAAPAGEKKGTLTLHTGSAVSIQGT